MDIAELGTITNQLNTLARNPRLWPREIDQPSVFLRALQVERDLHYLAAVRTLIEAHRSLTRWADLQQSLSGHQLKVIALARSSFESALAVLQADTWSNYLVVARSLAKSLATIFRLDSPFTIPDAIGNMDSLLNLPLAELQSLNQLLPAIEASMELMLLMAMWVDSQVRAITGAASPLELADVDKLKRPVIEKLQQLRQVMSRDAAARLHARVRFADEGFWPAGLRGVADIEASMEVAN